jgi:hypothetical protein
MAAPTLLAARHDRDSRAVAMAAGRCPAPRRFAPHRSRDASGALNRGTAIP